jgi:hypothetical protein
MSQLQNCLARPAYRTRGDREYRILQACVGRRLTADIATKSLRKAKAMIIEHGVDAVAAILQGKLEGNSVVEAGLVVQPKLKPAPPEPVGSPKPAGAVEVAKPAATSPAGSAGAPGAQRLGLGDLKAAALQRKQPA